MQSTSWERSKTKSILYDQPEPEQIITTARLNALGRICRWGGWTRRHYSVLEHTIIGAEIMIHLRKPAHSIIGFLLHDVEETEFSDRVAPLKSRHSSPAYFQDVARFNMIMCRQETAKVDWLTHPDVKELDLRMACMESRTISLRPDPIFDGHQMDQTDAMIHRLICTGDFANTDRAAVRFMKIRQELLRK